MCLIYVLNVKCFKMSKDFLEVRDVVQFLDFYIQNNYFV